MRPHGDCPHCGADLDSEDYVRVDEPLPEGLAQVVDDVRGIPELQEIQPVPGDVAICFYCARVIVFDEKLCRRAPLFHELESFLADPNVRRVIAAVKKYGPRSPGRVALEGDRR